MADESRNVAWLADRQLLLLDERSLDEALERLRPEGLRAAVASRRELLTLPSSTVADLVRHDPAGLFELTQKTFGGRAPIGIDGGYVTPDGSSRLVIARPRRPPYDAEFSRALDARLRASLPSSSSRRAEPALRVEMAGGHRIAVETEAFIRRESIVNTVGSLVLDSAASVFRVPKPLACGDRTAAVSAVAARRAGHPRFRGRHAVRCRHRIGRDAVRPRRRRRRPAVRLASPGAGAEDSTRTTPLAPSQSRRRACCSACGRPPPRFTG